MEVLVIVLGVLLLLALVAYLKRKVHESTSNIPKIIHQTAPSDRKKWNSLWFGCQSTWKALHPDFEYMFWSDEDIENFMLENYPEQYNSLFPKYDVKIKKIDAARYFILYHYGGIYADMDYKCQQRFFEELPDDKVSIAMSRVENDEGYQNALMISPKGHPFWEIVFRNLEQYKDKCDVLECTGPKVISRSVRELEQYVNSLSTDEYNPFFNHWNDSPDNYENAKAIHVHTYSWYHDDVKSKNS
jgi:mannosyltransferase OCH1-like enzyme